MLTMGMLCLTTSSITAFADSNSNYNRDSAVSYAHRWASSPNPNYSNYISEDAGGDCTNFVSQCVKAGGISNFRDWSPDSGPWILANQFRDRWKSKCYDYTVYTVGGARGFWLDVYNSLWPGDVVQYGNASRTDTSHSQIVTGYDSDTHTTYVAQHSTTLPACKDYIDLEGYLTTRNIDSAFYTIQIKNGN